MPHAAQLRRGFPWLRFEPALETEFRAYYWRRYLWRTRVALLLGVLAFCLFALKDTHLLPEDVWRWTVGVRLLVMVPTVLLIAALSFVKPLRRWMEEILAGGVLIAMGGLTEIILVSAVLGAPVRYEGLLLIIVFVFSLSGLRFYKASVSTLIIAGLYIFGGSKTGLPIAKHIQDAWYLLGTVGICMVGSYSLERVLRNNFLTENVARFRALQDPLTRLHNRRAATDHLRRSWRLAVRERHTLAILLIDVDHFKRFNDRYGHPRGDVCLTDVARVLANRFRRPMDMIARYGGEEFIGVAYGISEQALGSFCEDLRKGVFDLAVPHEGNTVDQRVTVSIGAVSVLPAGKSFTILSAISAADRALYRAKAQGRNRVEIAGITEGLEVLPAIKDHATAR